jgi:molybdopterin-guanine dinucleotide biosynthesis protein A
MGRPKGDLTYGGATLAARAAATLEPLVDEVLISIAPGAVSPAPGFRSVEDEPPAVRGPLAGVAAAFRAARPAELLVLACDYPFADRALFERILEVAQAGDDVVVAQDGAGREHPLVALWRGSAEEGIRDALAARAHTVRGALRGFRVRRVGPREGEERGWERRLTNWNALGDPWEPPGVRS